MKPGPANHVRIARPSHDLRASERFWVGGLGLEVLFRIDESADGDHVLVMVGWPGAAWHLELVHDPDDVTPAAPTEEDLLVADASAITNKTPVQMFRCARSLRHAPK